MKPSCVPPTVVVPELFRLIGGVQIFSQRFIEALDAIYGQPVPVVSRNDRSSDYPEEFLRGRKVVSCGALPSRLRQFALMAGTVKTSGSFTLTTHPNFTPWLKMLKKPYLTVAHGIDVWDVTGKPVAEGLAAAHHVLPVSQFTCDRMKEQLAGEMPPYSLFPNTFDEERFSPGPDRTGWRNRLGIGDGNRVMLSVCRVSKTERKKGFYDILESLPVLRKQHPELVWVLAGKGDALEEVKARARALGVAEVCRFTGFVPDEELVDLYRAADLFVLPSQKEGFGIVFLEAAATGLPVIAGNLDGSVDALAHGALGRLIRPGDSAALEQEVSAVLSSAPIDGQALHADCARRFGKEQFKANLESILRELNLLLS